MDSMMNKNKRVDFMMNGWTDEHVYVELWGVGLMLDNDVE